MSRKKRRKDQTGCLYDIGKMTSWQNWMAKGQEEVQNGGEDIIIYRQRDKIKENGAKTEQSVGH